MKVGSRFIVDGDYYYGSLAGETGVVIEMEENEYYIKEVLFDNPIKQELYIEQGERCIDPIWLISSNQKGMSDIEFEDKLKEALISLLERGEVEIHSDLEDDYGRKIITTRVIIDDKEIYSRRVDANV